MKLSEIYLNLIYEDSYKLNHKEYLKWKRKNVTLRGVSNVGEYNGGGAMLGDGLYTASLGNRQLSSLYGKVYFVLNAMPKNPLVVNSINDWEIWSQNHLFMKFSNDNFPNKREFFKKTTINKEMKILGYDGVIIKGREIVNYNPPNNIQYFSNERELETYYNYNIE